MNIPELSMSLAQADTMSNVGIAVLGKSLDSMETAGNKITEMMSSSMELTVNPAIGSNIDLYL